MYVLLWHAPGTLLARSLRPIQQTYVIFEHIHTARFHIIGHLETMHDREYVHFICGHYGLYIWKRARTKALRPYIRVISACLTLQDLLFSNGTAAIYRHAIATAPGRNISANDSSFSCEEVLAAKCDAKRKASMMDCFMCSGQ